MQRRFSVIIMFGVLALSPLVHAQEGPATTEEPAQQATPAPQEATPVPQATTAPPGVFGDALSLLVDARNDLEALATSELGRERPTGWNGGLDVSNPQLPLLIRLDLDLLARQLMGENNRPAGWFGAVASTDAGIARDIRHDLELLADAVLPEDFRPPGWAGGHPLIRCARSTQTLVQLLVRSGLFTLNVDSEAPDYCRQVSIETSRFVEVNLLAHPDATEGNLFAFNPFATPPVWTVNTDFAVAFLDRSATAQVGTVPNGTAITPVARSYAQFSNMMLVRGDNFLVFVDFRDTTVTEAQFADLPDVTTMDVEPSCGADWCGAG